MIVNIDNDGNVLFGSDTASTTAVQFMLFLLSQLKDSQFADFDYDPNSAYKDIHYDAETHELSWKKWGNQETYSMTTSDLQAYASQCVDQVTVAYATYDQAEAILSAISALPTSSDLATLATKEDVTGLATQSDLEPLAKTEDLAGLAEKNDLGELAKAADLEGIARTTDLQDLSTSDDIRRVEDLAKKAINRASLSALGSVVSTTAVVAAAASRSSAPADPEVKTLEVGGA